MTSVVWAIAAAQGTDVSSLGPFAAFGTLALAALGWLVKALGDSRADAKEARADNKVLVDRVFNLAENNGPVLATVKDAMDRNTRALDRITPDRDR